MLRDLLRFLASRAPAQSPDTDTALTGAYRVVADPRQCFGFEPLTEEGARRYGFRQMVEDWATSADEVAKLRTFPPRVARLDQGSVLGLSFLAVTRDRSTCLNFFTHNPVNPDKVTNFEDADTVRLGSADSITGRFEGVDRYDDGVLLGDHWNFGHWLYNHLARLALIASAPRLEGIPLVVGENLTASHAECLERMGYPGANLIRLRKGRLARFRTLWVPMMPLCGYEGVMFWCPGTIDFLRERLGVKLDAFPEPGRRLYVTRRSSRWRRVLNEEDLIVLLSRRGFEVVDPGTLSIARQVEIASAAEIILGPFGAGMNLLLFAPRGATIVEMKYQSDRMDLNPVLCRHLGQRYMAMAGTPVTTGATALNHDFTVEPARIFEAIEALGLRRK